MRILLRAGADRSLRDGEGRTAVDYARVRGFTELQAILNAR